MRPKIDPAFKSLLEHNRSLPTYDELRIALDESVRLQAHYAKLLNMHDAGKRMIFPTTALWLLRLRETGFIQGKLAGGTPALPGKGGAHV